MKNKSLVYGQHNTFSASRKMMIDSCELTTRPVPGPCHTYSFIMYSIEFYSRTWRWLHHANLLLVWCPDHVTHVSDHIYEWVMPHVRMSHVLCINKAVSIKQVSHMTHHITHTNESRHTYDWFISHTHESCHIYQSVMSRVFHVTIIMWMSETTHTDESYGTYE